MTREIPGSIVLMHESTVDSWYGLQNILQTLTEIMTISQAGVLIEDDVDFNVQFVSSVVGLQALDTLDSLGEAHGQVQQHIALVCCSCGTRQVADVCC